jgi:ureidoglycolate dehydrogenase (NAD+)
MTVDGDRMTQVLIHHEKLKQFLTDIFVAKGMSAADAAAVADLLAWANVRGIDGHGAVRLSSYLEFIDRGDLDPRAEPQIRMLGPTAFTLDGARAAGPVAMMKAAGHAVATARQYGVCIALVHDTTHTGAIGRYPQWVAEQGCACIMMNGGPPFMAYHGTRTANLGTSPISIAVPGPDAAPLLLDMATSVVSNGRLRQAIAAGETLPEGWALDADGKVTTDPKKAAVILPLGGPKGSGLSLMFECLTGILAASPLLIMYADPAGRKRHKQSAIMIVLNVEMFRPLADFRRDVGDLAAMIRKLPLQQGFDEALMPGERGERRAAARRAEGIPLTPALWKELSDIARALGVDTPTPLPA